MIFSPASCSLAAVLIAALVNPMTSGWAAPLPGDARLSPARSQLHPQLFALTPTDFPAGSEIVRAGVESNRRLAQDRTLHPELPPEHRGRLSGYYMEADQQDPPGAMQASTAGKLKLPSTCGGARGLRPPTTPSHPRLTSSCVIWGQKRSSTR